MDWVPIGPWNPSTGSVSFSILCLWQKADQSWFKLKKKKKERKKKKEGMYRFTHWLPVRLDSGLTDLTRPSSSLSVSQLHSFWCRLYLMAQNGCQQLPEISASHIKSREGLCSILTKPHWEWGRDKFFNGKLGYWRPERRRSCGGNHKTKTKPRDKNIRQELRIILGGLATQYGGCPITELGVVEEMRFSY